ncbi:cupin domain-containing protein [Photobacterium sp. BZF1]|uniref:cupin domain-containing protein n=1 Tax=Photobacterium sp. BZF1 TaxID=1904457 RepID=UPI001653ABD7|nr:cupin domain-containing protein [Photobacterium sp. BZF1]MBC7003029.1 cupin domain-containing protein [Photobacterium sp. BZF1]
MNDYQVKLAKFKGEFTWHGHKDTDELFLVVSGSMRIEFRDKVIELSEGEMYVVPKGVEHKPVAERECHVMLIEPKGVVNTGDAQSTLKAENDVWV